MIKEALIKYTAKNYFKINVFAKNLIFQIDGKKREFIFPVHTFKYSQIFLNNELLKMNEDFYLLVEKMNVEIKDNKLFIITF